jgi:hypothetical protein
MSHNPNMLSSERVLWRQVCQAAHEAARDPAAVGKAKALNKALAGSEGWRLPDLRPLPSACFRAFLMTARSWNRETDLKVRAELAHRLAALADAAGDILDGLACDRRDPGAWSDRADLQ